MDWAGVSFDGVTTAENTGWSPVLPMSDKLDALFARWASTAYDRFVNLVAEGRNKEPDYIRSIAGGRVWIGSKAQELGLVDAMGDLDTAITAAAELAQLDDHSVDYVTKKPSKVMMILKELQGGIGVRVTSEVITFSDYMTRIFGVFEDVSEPRATVLCTECMVEL
jgi:protease-4